MREINWYKAARKAFQAFPEAVQIEVVAALEKAADGQLPASAKPLKGLGSGVFEIIENDAAGTFRVVYAVRMADAIIVVHAFQKKSKRGIATPRFEIDTVRERLKRLKGGT